ncbi:hypothetical protein BGZ58_000791, partial [Dissophora ornata]
MSNATPQKHVHFDDTTLTAGWTDDGDGVITDKGQSGEPVVQRLLSDNSRPGPPKLGV